MKVIAVYQFFMAHDTEAEKLNTEKSCMNISHYYNSMLSLSVTVTTIIFILLTDLK